MGYPDPFDLTCFLYLPNLFQFAVDLNPAVESYLFQFSKGDVAPFRVLKVVVENCKTPEQVISVILRYIPVAPTDEKMQVNQFIPPRYMLGFVKLGDLR